MVECYFLYTIKVSLQKILEVVPPKRQKLKILLFSYFKGDIAKNCLTPLKKKKQNPFRLKGIIAKIWVAVSPKNQQGRRQHGFDGMGRTHQFSEQDSQPINFWAIQVAFVILVLKLGNFGVRFRCFPSFKKVLNQSIKNSDGPPWLRS